MEGVNTNLAFQHKSFNKPSGHNDIPTVMRNVRLTDKAAHQEFLRPYREAAPGTMKVVE